MASAGTGVPAANASFLPFLRIGWDRSAVERSGQVPVVRAAERELTPSRPQSEYDTDLLPGRLRLLVESGSSVSPGIIRRTLWCTLVFLDYWLQ
jgi:hypothetical protein